MKQIELLSPVGKSDSARSAIANGADAIYLGGMKFGARAFAENFDLNELKEVIDYAHLYHVRVFVTMNTIIFEDEIEECLQYVKQLYDLNVDAIIVQDLGLLYLLRTRFPDFEVHASTQMHIYNRSALLFLKQQGVKRAVLARECTLEKINSFKDIDIEKEVFVHGALCISYSGQCLFSAFNNERSGNRGMCAQGCRMSYRLLREDKPISKEAYLLSPRDLNTLDHVKELKDAGIDSFKIEGRMKSAEYVGYTTNLYRQAIDYGKHVDDESLDKLKVLFNRTYTKGHLFHDNGPSLMNHSRPNHVGVEIGRVTKVNKEKFVVKLVKDLHQGDGIRLIQKEDVGFVANWIYKDGLLVNKAYAMDEIELDKTSFVEVGARVVMTKDSNWEKELRQAYMSSASRRVPLKAEVYLEVDKPMKLRLSDTYGNVVDMYSKEVVQAAVSKPLTKEDIEKQLRKTKDTIYDLDEIQIHQSGSLFMPIKQLNEVRREALLQMDQVVLKSFKRENSPFVIDEAIKENREFVWSVSVLNEEQLKVSLTYDVQNIYVEDSRLYETYKEDKRVKRSSSNIFDKEYKDISLSDEIGGLKEGMHLDASFNLSNSYALEYVSKLKVASACLSLELKEEQISSIATAFHKRNKQYGDIELVVYGKPKLMSSEYCVVNDCVSKNGKKDCVLCKHKKYFLEDSKQNKFYMRGDENCTMHMYHNNSIDKSRKMEHYKQLGIQRFRLSFTSEKEQEMKEIYRKFQI